MKNPNKVKQGKKNRAAGKRFELKVREDLEKANWIVFRNSNDVSDVIETDIGEYERFFKQAKTKWNFITKMPMSIQSGFPDYVCIHSLVPEDNRFLVKFVECKINGQLSKEEKEKCKWIIEKLEIPVIIASRGKKRGEIIYENFKEKYI